MLCRKLSHVPCTAQRVLQGALQVRACVVWPTAEPQEAAYQSVFLLIQVAGDCRNTILIPALQQHFQEIPQVLDTHVLLLITAELPPHLGLQIQLIAFLLLLHCMQKVLVPASSMVK